MSRSRTMKNREFPVYLGPVNCWKALGIAIVRQAIIDWRETLLAATKVDGATRESLERHNSAESFLKSSWVEMFAGIDGPTLLRKLKDGSL